MKRVIVKNHEGKELVVQRALIPSGYFYVGDYVEPIDFASLTIEELQDIKNDDLKAYLDRKGIEYEKNAAKGNLIELIKK